MVAKKTNVKKTGKPRAKKPSKLQSLEEKAQLYDKIRAKEKERRKLLARFQELKDECKEAKQALGYCETEICGLGHALDEKHPLFDAAQQNGEQAASEAASKVVGDAWKAQLLSVAGIDAEDCKRLEKANVKTLGDLQAMFKELDKSKAGPPDDEPTKRVREKLAAFLKTPTKQPAANDDAWKTRPIEDAIHNPKHVDSLQSAGIRSLKALSDAMNNGGQFWAKNAGVPGRFRQPIEDAFNSYLMDAAQKAA